MKINVITYNCTDIANNVIHIDKTQNDSVVRTILWDLNTAIYTNKQNV